MQKLIELTISLSSLGSSTLAHGTLVLEIEIPALFLALVVLDVESDDRLSLVDGLFALGSISL